MKFFEKEKNVSLFTYESLSSVDVGSMRKGEAKRKRENVVATFLRASRKIYYAHFMKRVDSRQRYA